MLEGTCHLSEHSSIHKHAQIHGASVHFHRWIESSTIILYCSTTKPLRFLEAFYIKRKKPTINKICFNRVAQVLI